MPSLSRRLPHAAPRNAITERLGALRSRGIAIDDLTESNPTKVGLSYPDGLLTSLSDTAGLTYEPTPFGLLSARQAVAADIARRGAQIDPQHIVLTASSSESYSWLFKVYCDPGQRVLVPRPSYPLFEHLASLEGVLLSTYDLDYRGRWDVDLDAIAAEDGDVRAVVVVSPNNPTGACLNRAELGRIGGLCLERGWLLIADEVFADYLLDRPDPPQDLAAHAACLTVSLGGLSKCVGLPQLKLGWMIVGGPPRQRDALLAALELVADTYLSVSTPVQLSLCSLLGGGASIRQAIVDRIRTNVAELRTVVARFDGCDVPAVDGGWSAVVRVPALRSEEEMVLDILEHERVLVHPGYYYDFRHEAYLVVSLLVAPEVFSRAITRALTRVAR